MSKFKVEIASPNGHNWNTTCFPEPIEADSEEEATEIAKDIFNKCFDNTADEYIYWAIAVTGVKFNMK